MTIVLADADARFRDSLKRRLEKITGVEVVGEASDSEEATAMILNRKPDIAILNSSLQASSGIGVLEHIRKLMVPPTIFIVTDAPARGDKTPCSLVEADLFFDQATESHKMIDAVRLLCTPRSQIESLDSPFATRDE